MSRLPSEVWEPDALTAHVRIYEGPRVNEAKYQKIQAPTKYWLANRESTRYDKPKRPRTPAYSPGAADDAGFEINVFWRQLRYRRRYLDQRTFHVQNRLFH